MEALARELVEELGDAAEALLALPFVWGLEQL